MTNAVGWAVLRLRGILLGCWQWRVELCFGIFVVVLLRWDLCLKTICYNRQTRGIPALKSSGQGTSF